MNNSFKRLLSMVLAVMMCISSTNFVAAYTPQTADSADEVISGSAVGIEMSDFSANPVLGYTEFAPDNDYSLEIDGVATPVNGYYIIGNVALLGSNDSLPSISISQLGNDFDGESFDKVAVFNKASDQDGNFIAFAVDEPAEVIVYSQPNNQDEQGYIGIQTGLPGGTVTEANLDIASAAIGDKEAIHRFSVKEAGQYSIAATTSVDVAKVVVIPDSYYGASTLADSEETDNDTGSVNAGKGTLAGLGKGLDAGTVTFANVTDDTAGVYFTNYGSSSAQLKSGIANYLLIKPNVNGTLTFAVNQDKAMTMYDVTDSYTSIADSSLTEENKIKTASEGSIANTGFPVEAGKVYFFNTETTGTTRLASVTLTASTTSTDTAKISVADGSVTNGTVTISDGTNTTTLDSTKTTAIVDVSKTWTVTAAANDGYELTSLTYTVNDGAATDITSGGTLTGLVADGTVVITPVFSAKPTYSAAVTITADANGTISSITGADGADVTGAGNVYTLAAGTYTVNTTPNDNYEFDSIVVTGSDKVTANGSTITVADLTADVTATATVSFKEKSTTTTGALDGKTYHFTSGTDTATDIYLYEDSSFKTGTAFTFEGVIYNTSGYATVPKAVGSVKFTADADYKVTYSIANKNMSIDPAAYSDASLASEVSVFTASGSSPVTGTFYIKSGQTYTLTRDPSASGSGASYLYSLAFEQIDGGDTPIPTPTKYTVSGTITDSDGAVVTDTLTIKLCEGDSTSAAKWTVTGTGSYSFADCELDSAKSYYIVVDATDSYEAYTSDAITVPTDSTAITNNIVLTKKTTTVVSDKYVWDFNAKKALPTGGSDTIYSVTGSLNGSNQLKMETKTSITVNADVAGTLYIYSNAASGKKIKFDGIEYSADADGKFTIENVTVVQHTVTKGDSFQVDKFEFVPTGGSGEETTYGSINGKVYYVDSESGANKPLAGATVVISNPNDENFADITLTTGTDGSYDTHAVLPAGTYEIEIAETSSYTGYHDSSVVVTESTVTTHTDIVLNEKINADRTFTIKVTNNTGAAGTLNIHSDTETNADAFVDVLQITDSADLQQFTVTIPDGGYTLYFQGAASSLTTDGKEGRQFTVTASTIEHNVIINPSTDNLTPLVSGTTYSFGTSSGKISATNENFILESIVATNSSNIQLGSSSAVKFMVDDSDGNVVTIKFSSTPSSSALPTLRDEKGNEVAVTLNSKTNTVTLPEGTYVLVGSTAKPKLASITSVGVEVIGGTVSGTNNIDEAVTLTFTGKTSGKSFTVDAAASGTFTQEVTGVTPDTYTITAKGTSDQSYKVTGDTEPVIDTDGFVVSDLVIDAYTAVTLVLNNPQKQSITVDGTSNAAATSSYEAEPGTTYTFAVSSSKINVWSVTSDDSTVDCGYLVCVNGKTNKHFEYTIPANAKSGTTYTVTFDNSTTSKDESSHDVDYPEVGYGQYGFGGEKIYKCGNFGDDSNARKNFNYLLRVPTAADFNNSQIAAGNKNEDGWGQEHINSDINDSTGTLYSLGNQFGLLENANGGYVKFKINVNGGNVYCKLDYSGTAVTFYDETDKKNVEILGTDGTKKIYDVKDGHTYSLTSSGSTIMKSVRLLNPDNMFFNATDGNVISSTSDSGFWIENEVPGTLGKNLNVTSSTATTIYRVIGALSPSTLSAANTKSVIEVAGTIDELGWTIVEAAAVDEFNAMSKNTNYFMPGDRGSLSGDVSNEAALWERLQNTTDYAITDKLNSGIRTLDESTGEDADGDIIGIIDSMAGYSAESLDKAYAVRYFRVTNGKRYYAFPYTKAMDSDKAYTKVAKADVADANAALVKQGVVVLGSTN